MQGCSNCGNDRCSHSDPCPVEHLAAAYRGLLALGIRDRTTYAEILRQTLEANASLMSVWTVWEPDALDARDAFYRHAPGHDATGRFIPCWHRAAGEARLEPATGYEEPGEGDWYWIAKRRGSSCRTSSFQYPLGGRLVWIVSQVVPILREGKFVAAVGVDCPAPGHPVPAPPRRSQITARPLHTSRLHQLTPREREVHHWLALGKSNEEIGIILGISHHTVKNHLERIFQKLGVNNRIEAIHAGHDSPA